MDIFKSWFCDQENVEETINIRGGTSHCYFYEKCKNEKAH